MRLKKILIGAFIIIVITPFSFPQLRVPVEPERSNLMHSPNNSTFSFEKNIINLNLGSEEKPGHEIASSCGTQDSQSTKFKMKKSPLVAVMLSAVLPGAGQFYNKSYWKIPIIAGLVGYFGYEYINNNNKFKDYRDQYDATITPSNPFGDENLKTLREFYRNQRDDFVWYFIIVYVVNLVDAYVDAHLFDFDVKEEKLTGSGSSNIYLKVNINF